MMNGGQARDWGGACESLHKDYPEMLEQQGLPNHWRLLGSRKWVNGSRSSSIWLKREPMVV